MGVAQEGLCWTGSLGYAHPSPTGKGKRRALPRPSSYKVTTCALVPLRGRALPSPVAEQGTLE